MTEQQQIRVVIEGDEAPRPDRVAKAEREAAHWNAETTRLRAEAHRNRVAAARMQVDAGLQTAAAEAEAARSAYKDSLDRGDFEAAAQVVEKLTEVEVRRRELQHHEQALARTPAVPADPVEAYCANRTEPTQRWLRAHREWVMDPAKNARLTAAHYDAVEEKLVPDTEAYFEFVERAIGLRDGGRRRVEAKYNPADVNTHARGSSVYLTPGEAERAVDGTRCRSRTAPTSSSATSRASSTRCASNAPNAPARATIASASSSRNMAVIATYWQELPCHPFRPVAWLM